jgi:hypothetical protein
VSECRVDPETERFRNAGPAWAYALIPGVRDPPHGVAALILAGIAASFTDST